MSVACDTRSVMLSSWQGGPVWTTGIDLVPIDRASRLLSSGGAARTDLFSPGELDYCGGGAASAARFAARLAAKEATLKALGLGLSVPPALNRLRAIEVCQSGAEPRLRLHGRLADAALRRGVVGGALSMSHAAGLAIAHVVLGWSASTTSDGPVASAGAPGRRGGEWEVGDATR